MRTAAKATLIVTIALMISCSQARAQAEPLRANPPMGQAVPVMPGTIELWFSEAVQSEGIQLEVFRQDGTRVDQDNAALDLQDVTASRVTVGVHPGLDNGEYQVIWSVVSAVDGTASNGSYVFIVDPGASPEPLPQIATQQAPAQLPKIDDDGNPVDTDRNPLLYGIAAVVTGLAFLGLMIFWYFRRAARGRRWSDRPVDRL